MFLDVRLAVVDPSLVRHLFTKSKIILDFACSCAFHDYTFVSKLNVFIKMEQRIFIWLAQERKRTEFIQWAQASKRLFLSYPTLSRAMERQYTGVALTPRQSGIAKVAEEFKQEIQGSAQAA